MGLKREITKEMVGYRYRIFRCSGQHCTFERVALEFLELTCNTPGCRGSVTPRRVIPNAEVAVTLVRRMVNTPGGLNPALPVRFRTINATTERQIRDPE